MNSIPKQNTSCVSRAPFKDSKILQSSIDKLISNGAIQKCKHKKGEFLSPYFLVPKPNGDFRFVLNLKQLNKHIKTDHFKLENLKNVKDLITPNVFMCTIDLKDAYYFVPIAKGSRKYLRFIFENSLYEFRCLPFGLATAPYVFCKLMKPIICYLRSRSLLSVNYLDDFLLIANSESECIKNYEITSRLLCKIGFRINEEKSQRVPLQRCRFLGFVLDSCCMKIFLPEEKVEKSLIHIQRIRDAKTFKIREFAKLIGYLISICPAFTYGWLYTKRLEHLKCKTLRYSQFNFNCTMSLNEDCRTDLVWWVDNIDKSGCKMYHNNFSLEIFSDASRSGWGASCGLKYTRGFWDTSFKERHINYLELMAAFLALKSFAKDFSECDILLRSDNKTVIALINRMGSSKYSHLHDLTKNFWEWCQSRNIWVWASYIASKENIIADRESRLTNIDTEYSLNLNVFREIIIDLGTPEVDLFASYLNKKCSNFVSWKQDPESTTVDAFSISWGSVFFYAFPPFSIIGRVLNKINDERATGIVVVPKWESQPWYPVFMNLLISEPLYFKPDPNLLLSPYRESHPMWKRITLVDGKLSGRHTYDET